MTQTFRTRPRYARSLFYAVVTVIMAAAAPAAAQRALSIAAVQGSGNISEHQNKEVRVSGIVTARVRSGFFIQAPDGQADKDPNTSEGIYVFTRNAPDNRAAVGALVTVTGMVEEFRLNSDPNTLTLTEIAFRSDRDTIKVESSGNPLPAPITLSLSDVKDNRIDQLEKYEGMRVRITEAMVVAPTNGRIDPKTGSVTSDGVFYAVIKGLPRTYREPGLDIFEYAFLNEKDKAKMKADHPKIPIFDANPERIRVETNAQSLVSEVDIGEEARARGIVAVASRRPATLDVSAGAAIGGLSGVLTYSRRTYTLLADPTPAPTVTSTVKPVPMPAPSERLFVVSAMNLENFFDEEDNGGDVDEDIVTAEAFERRLKKISAAVREVMLLPDVIGIVEAENLSGLRRLAQRINSESVSAGKPDPKYEAFLVDGNDGRGIDNGFLVKTSRVKVIDVKQHGVSEKYKHPGTGEEIFVNDRPPLVLRASVEDKKKGTPFEFTVVVNHLKSYLGFTDPKQRENVRLKKRLQAEYLAKFVQERQRANPAEKIILVGDFNSFQFSDGVLDMIGTIKGKPAAPSEVLLASEDLVDPDMINLVDLIEARQRYSYIFDGNSQVLDHILVTAALRPHVNGFGYVRLNADFPEIYRNDASRMERFSDHDPAIAYFSLDPR